MTPICMPYPRVVTRRRAGIVCLLADRWSLLDVNIHMAAAKLASIPAGVAKSHVHARPEADHCCAYTAGLHRDHGTAAVVQSLHVILYSRKATLLHMSPYHDQCAVQQFPRA